MLRLFKILYVVLAFGLDEFLLGHRRTRGLRRIFALGFFWRDLSAPRGERLRLAL